MTFLLPSKHPEKLSRFMRAAREVGTSVPGLVLVSKRDWEAMPLAWQKVEQHFPTGWAYRVVEADSYGGALREAWPLVKDMAFVGLVADDLVPSSANWDTQLLRHLRGWNFVTANDERQVHPDIAIARMHGATVFSGPLLRAIGGLFPEGPKHLFHDDYWETIGRETGAWQTVMDVVTRHDHDFYLTGHRDETMDPSSALWRHDEAWFRRWLEAERPAVIERVKACLAEHGVHVVNPDLTGVRLMICTPCHDGKPERLYNASLWKTMQMLHAKGCAATVMEENYTADIALARSNLFSGFFRSNATHMLFIDADMGWEPGAVLRLFATGKDVVGVAGPKKRYPLAFAANFTDKDGNAVELPWDPETGTHEVGELGAAFLLISRAAAEKMVEHYAPTLEFTWTGGERVFGLFIPMVDPALRKWYSEDFAFCRRWRDIGGKVHVCADVRLQHVGSHVYEGALGQLFTQQKPAAPPAPPPLQEAAE
jgi:hypothetical protein